MAKGQKHIDDDGNVGNCRATKNCPFEGRGHYDTQREAEAAYEVIQQDSAIPESFKRAKTPKNGGFGLEEGGYYGSTPPREVQIEALNDTAEALLQDGNTQLVAACGTGKSFMGRQLMRRMMEEEDANGVAIVLTSSVKLAADTAADLKPDAEGNYDGAMGTYNEDYAVEVIEINHEASDIKTKGAIDEEKIAKRWKDALDEGKRVVVVSTYHSADMVQKVQEMIGERAEADLLMNDEAHNILGQKNSTSTKAEADNAGYKSYANEIPGAIQSKRRLYATATPTTIESPDDQSSSISNQETALEDLQKRAQQMEKNGKLRMTVYASDEAIVGKISGTITKEQAVEAKCLADTSYQLRSSVIKGDPSSAKGGFVDHTGTYINAAEDGAQPLTAQTYTAVSATLEAMAADPSPGQNPSHNALAYCGGIAQAEAFRDNFSKVADNLSEGMSTAEARKHVNSEDPDLKRRARMKLMAEEATVLAAHSGNSKEEKDEKAKAFKMFAGKDIKAEDVEKGWSAKKNVLANVDIFSEGVSINEIDTVVIADTGKTSEKAMTQAVGRAARKIGGNDYKNTGHVIIPQALDEKGNELNGGLVASATYGSTRFERGVATRKLRGESVAADTSTTIARYDHRGRYQRSELTADVARSHIQSPNDLVAASAIERADNSLRALPKGASPEKKAEVTAYRAMSQTERSQVIREKIAKEAVKENGDPAWRVADEILAPKGGGSFDAIRQSGRVATSALAANDFTALPEPVIRKLTDAQVIRPKSTGGGSAMTIEEKREVLLKNANAIAMPLTGVSGKDFDPNIADAVGKGTKFADAFKYANTEKGPSESYLRTMSNYQNLVQNDDAAVEKIWAGVESAENASNNAPLFGRLINQYNSRKKVGLWESMGDLRTKVKTRAADSAASGNSDFELGSSAITSSGYLSASAQRSISEIL